MEKAQSAMEYLATYSWAIFIIIIVAGVLFYIGIFNKGGLSPGASGGSCVIVRPRGPGSTEFLSRQGLCNVNPRFVATFNGLNSWVDIHPNSLLTSGNLTVTAWADIRGPSRDFFNFIVVKNGDWNIAVCGTSSFFLCYYEYGGMGGSGLRVLSKSVCNCTSYNNAPIQTNKWYFVSIVITNATKPYAQESVYLDGNTTPVLVGGALMSIGGSPTYTLENQNVTIGYGLYGNQFMNGSIADVQIYNTALSPSGLQQLYLEGIGGAPINLQALAGWWPLNGNTQDYSGNKLNGFPTGDVGYSNQWTTDYTIP
jgi:hypothetical protein